MYFVRPEDRPRFRREILPEESAAYGEAIEIIYRALGGGKMRAHTPEDEQREIDLFSVSRLLWDVREALHHMPERIAQQVWLKSPWAQQG